MPYPNEHSCRIREPGEFEDGSFRRIKSGKLSIIIGKLKGKPSTTTQAYRYPKDTWSAEAARAHCKAQGGRFEAASQDSREEDYVKEEVNPFIPRLPEDK
jgi:hypothetical protein